MADYKGPYTGAQVDAALKAAMETPAKLAELKTYVDLHPQYEKVEEIEAPEIDLGGGGATVGGLKYSEERTIYIGDLTEEQRAYNVETFNKILAGEEFITINAMGIFMDALPISETLVYLTKAMVVTVGETAIFMPLGLSLNNEGDAAEVDLTDQLQSTTLLYVPIEGATLSDTQKQNNIALSISSNIKRIEFVPRAGYVTGVDALPIAFEIAGTGKAAVMCFYLTTMYKATVDFSTGDVVTSIVGTLTAPTE